MAEYQWWCFTAKREGSRVRRIYTLICSVELNSQSHVIEEIQHSNNDRDKKFKHKLDQMLGKLSS